MTSLYKTFINSKNEILEIHFDMDGSFANPMRDRDTLFNYYTWHNRYQSMQENNFGDFEEWYDSLLGDGAFNRQREKSIKNNRSVVGFANDLCFNLDKAGIVAVPILCYEHSDIHYYIGNSIDYFDGSIAGVAWQRKEVLRNEYHVQRITKSIREVAFKVVEAELVTYTNWCNGNVFGYILYNAEGEQIDSCWGFVSEDDNNLLENILSYVDTDDTNFVERENQSVIVA